MQEKWRVYSYRRGERIVVMASSREEAIDIAERVPDDCWQDAGGTHDTWAYFSKSGYDTCLADDDEEAYVGELLPE